MAKFAVAVCVGTLAILGLAGCGDSSSSDDVTAASTGAVAATPGDPLPQCGDVWVAKAKLPKGYAGCVKGGVTVEAKAQHCSSGQTLVTYADAFYAVTGGPVQHVPHLSDRPIYKRITHTCGG